MTERTVREDQQGKQASSPDANTFPRFLTSGEVAAILHIHVNTVRRWSDTGLLRAYRLGPRRDRRFRSEDIRKFPWANGL